MAHISAARQRAASNVRRSRTFAHYFDASDSREPRRTLPGIDEIGVLGRRGTSRAEISILARYISSGFISPITSERNDSEREHRRGLLLRHMADRFGRNWRERDWEQPQEDLNSDWWMVEPRFHLGTARLVSLL